MTVIQKPYDNYVKANISWFNSLPTDWEIKRLGVLFYDVKNKNSNYKIKNALKFRFGEIVAKNQIGSEEELKDTYEKYTIVKNNDIVINGLNLNYDFITQRVGIVRQIGIITSAYITISPRESVYSRYFYYLLKSFDDVKALNGIGTGIRLTLSFSELKKQYLPVPSQPEQDQIVKFLDHKILRINKFIKAKKREIELLKELKQAEINHAVTKGLDPSVPMNDSGIDWLGEIPVHWEVNYLSQVGREQSVSNKIEKNQNLLSLSYGKIVNKDINTTEGLLPASFDTYQIVQNGNIILRLTDLQNDHKSLRVGLVTQKGIITSAYTCIKPNHRILPEYLYLLLHSFDICKVFYGMGGGLRQSIGFMEIKRLRILLPPVEEQKKIVEKCRNASENIERMIIAIEKEISFTQEFKSSLISEVVTGKVDVRDVKIEDEWVDSMLGEAEEMEEVDVEEEVAEE